MSQDSELVKRHVEALLEEARSAGVPEDVVGRLLLQEVVSLWQRARSWQDVARELEFVAANLDPDTDYEFMRP